MEVTMEPTYETEATEEVILSESDISDEPELETLAEDESFPESTEEDPLSVSENEIETEVSSDLDEEEATTDEYAFYGDMISGADTEALILSIDQQTEVIQKGDAAICAGLGILIGILLIQGFRLRRI